jgi:ring-1,2-phenylacetyl-CoA epoxidase subunit PaaE
MSKSFHALKVSNVRPETADAVSVTFEVPESLKEQFQYTQGQYLTLRFDIKGDSVRRAYSMCSSPLEEGLTVTVKRVKKGLVSNYINDKLKPGDVVDVMEPDGRFFSVLDPEQRKTYYLIAAGSGITPLYSILKTILEKEPKSTVFLLYGNRDEDSIIFKKGLDELATRYQGQLEIEYLLSRPKRQKKGLFSKGVVTWEGQIGRIDAACLDRFLEEKPARSSEVEYFICGPGGMIEGAEKALKEKGLPEDHIHVEYFTNAPGDEVSTEAGVAAKVKVHLEDQDVEVFRT